MAKTKIFTNGFTSWKETFFEITEYITLERAKDTLPPKLQEIQEAQGTCGFWELAEELTDKFEKINKDREWDGEFYEAVVSFCNSEIKGIIGKTI